MAEIQITKIKLSVSFASDGCTQLQLHVLQTGPIVFAGSGPPRLWGLDSGAMDLSPTSRRN